MYGVCGHTFAVSAYNSTLTLFLQLQKDRHSVDLLELLKFETPSGSRTKRTKRNIILSISSTDLTKLKSLLKYNNQPEV